MTHKNNLEGYYLTTRAHRVQQFPPVPFALAV